MDLGVRQIRTAGKGSGSIELTLPAELRDLVGLPCKVTLRDGSRPDIVLRPDLGRVHDAFSALWHPMQAALMPEDPTAFPSSAFEFGLHPRAASADVPFLCWRDGLLLAAYPPYEAAAVSRTVAAFAQAMAADLGLDPDLAIGFGTACGWRLAGAAPAADAQEACDLVALHLPRGRPPLAAAGGDLDAAFWALAAPALNATADLFAAWTADPARHAVLRAAWRRGRAIELNGD
jgi:hypothetical protein